MDDGGSYPGGPATRVDEREDEPRTVVRRVEPAQAPEPAEGGADPAPPAGAGDQPELKALVGGAVLAAGAAIVKAVTELPIWGKALASIAGGGGVTYALVVSLANSGVTLPFFTGGVKRSGTVEFLPYANHEAFEEIESGFKDMYDSDPRVKSRWRVEFRDSAGADPEGAAQSIQDRVGREDVAVVVLGTPMLSALAGEAERLADDAVAIYGAVSFPEQVLTNASALTDVTGISNFDARLLSRVIQLARSLCKRGENDGPLQIVYLTSTSESGPHQNAGIFSARLEGICRSGDVTFAAKKFGSPDELDARIRAWANGATCPDIVVAAHDSWIAQQFDDRPELASALMDTKALVISGSRSDAAAGRAHVAFGDDYRLFGRRLYELLRLRLEGGDATARSAAVELPKQIIVDAEATLDLLERRDTELNGADSAFAQAARLRKLLKVLGVAGWSISDEGKRSSSLSVLWPER